MEELRAAALAALRAADVDHKLAAVADLAAAAAVDVNARLRTDDGVPGRPPRPRLVAPSAVPARAIATTAGRAALLHALAHIEFNAINLALDALVRFERLPPEYYFDWRYVAQEEAAHFALLRARLRTLQLDYGAFDAHDGLWEAARRTAHDPLARMALVPRTLEARGLDASPAIMAKFERAGDAESAAVVAIILRDEIGHVAIGNRWYRHLCVQRGLDPLEQQDRLARCLGAPALRGPFNLEARRAAGFSEAELARLI
jgi:uncharacterized ferritin-like protein (DUF455 family)